MKLGLRFYLSWISSAIVMFVLFYLWHGTFLNDFKRIQFPVSWLITFAVFTYLVLGAGIYLLYESRIMKTFRNFIVRGLICGAVAGFSLFVIATIVNISLTQHLSSKHLLIDCAWQMVEQIFGAMVIVAFKIFIHEPLEERA
ncbi:MAG: hypothetical protein KF900_07010 [Bacteroidetes bacterium]|nr:hypothetical protein [Bacteroidota bacterium]